MDQYIIKGGMSLAGEVVVSGAKNAALGILAAAIMTDEEVLIDNLPDVKDINVMLEAIAQTGVYVDRINRNKVKINASKLHSCVVDDEYIRRIRACILEEINKDYVIALKSKGISYSKIMFFHILPNSLLTIVTMFGMSIGAILGGTTIIETIFEYRGLGKMAADAITNRDYFLMQGYVIWTAIIYVVINLLVDILYKYLNPRIEIGDEN